MFQNNPIKLAKRTLYWIGTNIKFTIVAAGHIFQLVIKVSFILFWTKVHPFLIPLVARSSLTQLAKTKKPVKKMGAKRSWSSAIPTAANLKRFAPSFGLEVGLIILLTILGISLEYQKCRAGPKYKAPVIVKLIFLRISN